MVLARRAAYLWALYGANILPKPSRSKSQMAIPTAEALMLPLLRLLIDGHERTNQEMHDALAAHFRLTEAERDQLLPSGRARIFTNRLAWAKVHLKAAGLVESPRRGQWRITESGRQLASGPGAVVNRKVLKTIPQYLEWAEPKAPGGGEPPEGSGNGPNSDLTPEEHLEYGHEKAREQLAADVLDQLNNASPAFFERVVVDLLIAMGYGGSRQDAGSTLGKSGDGGVDGVIKEDRLGLDVIYLQAKRWGNTVGRPEIQKFAGALQGQRARKGVFITTADFSRDAIDFASRIDTRIVLIDGQTLATLMIDHGVGVTTVTSYHLKRIDSDYFDEGAV